MQPHVTQNYLTGIYCKRHSARRPEQEILYNNENGHEAVVDLLPGIVCHSIM